MYTQASCMITTTRSTRRRFIIRPRYKRIHLYVGFSFISSREGPTKFRYPLGMGESIQYLRMLHCALAHIDLDFEWSSLPIPSPIHPPPYLQWTHNDFLTFSHLVACHLNDFTKVLCSVYVLNYSIRGTRQAGAPQFQGISKLIDHETKQMIESLHVAWIK